MLSLLRLVVCLSDFVILGAIYIVLSQACNVFTLALTAGVIYAWWKNGAYHHWTDWLK